MPFLYTYKRSILCNKVLKFLIRDTTRKQRMKNTFNDSYHFDTKTYKLLQFNYLANNLKCDKDFLLNALDILSTNNHIDYRPNNDNRFSVGVKLLYNGEIAYYEKFYYSPSPQSLPTGTLRLVSTNA